MISMGFNAAISVRVSNELGAGHPKAAGFSVIVVNVVTVIISVIFAIGLLSIRHVVSHAFTSGQVVADAVADLSPLLAVTIILNGVQPVLSGVAVGCGWQKFVAYVNVGAYYVIGVPLGAVTGFYFKKGAKGIWIGMLGGILLQTMILVWVTVRTDWNKEVEISMKRLDKWDEKVKPDNEELEEVHGKKSNDLSVEPHNEELEEVHRRESNDLPVQPHNEELEKVHGRKSNDHRVQPPHP